MLRNGIHLSDFQGEEKRRRKRLIYSSHPTRGLVHLPDIFLELRRRHSDVELAVFSSSAVYRPTWPPVNLHEGSSEPLLNLLRSLPGCQVFGSTRQNLLAREFMKSAIWAYPTDFKESSCITAMEAQAGVCANDDSFGSLARLVGDGNINSS